MTITGDYIIRGGADGKKRLGVLADVLHKTTRKLLEVNGVQAGASLLDVGCGGGHVAIMAAEMVGDTGKVTAIDFDADIIALNQQDAHAQGITNIAYHAMSAFDMNFPGGYDLAYSRFLLSHLKAPQQVLANMMDSVKPGGKIIVEDVQFSGHFCYPACSAFTDYVKLYTASALQRGQNPELGPLLPALLEDAGMEQVQFDVIQPAFNTGAGKWMAYITMDRIKDTILEQGLADQPAINKLMQELEAFTNHTHTIISIPRIFRAWGIKRG